MSTDTIATDTPDQAKLGGNYCRILHNAGEQLVIIPADDGQFWVGPYNRSGPGTILASWEEALRELERERIQATHQLQRPPGLEPVIMLRPCNCRPQHPSDAVVLDSHDPEPDVVQLPDQGSGRRRARRRQRVRRRRLMTVAVAATVAATIALTIIRNI